MIIQCKKCRSKFNLDESKVKDKGIKVKCSVCGNTFRVYPEPEEALKETEKSLEPEAKEQFAPEHEGGEGDQEPVEEIMLDEEQKEEQEQEPEQMISVEELSWKEDEVSVEEVEEGEIPSTEESMESIEEATYPESGSKSNLLWIIGIAFIVLIFVGGGAVMLFMPDLIPDSLSFLKITKRELPEDPGVALLSFSSVKGTFIQTDNGKQRFIIQGYVINKYRHPRSYIMVMGSILDSKGRTVRAMKVYAGNTFKEKELKSLPLGEILKSLRRRSGKGGSNVNIKPGARVPFMIVFEDLPEDMSEFAVEGVRSIRGK